MFNRKVFLLISLFILHFLPAYAGLPPVLDCGKYRTDSNYGNIAYHLGYLGFNQAPELSPLFSVLRRAYKIDTAVETGTFNGATSISLSFIFDQVHTIEIVDSTFSDAYSRLKNYSNIHCHLGSSEKVLYLLLPALQDQRVLFYLDAHWENYWPLLDELEEISKTHKDNCIIVIDDFKVPGRSDIPYDAYGSHECSHEYVKAKLSKVFTSYTFHYIIPENPQLSRAKFVAIPKSWQ